MKYKIEYVVCKNLYYKIKVLVLVKKYVWIILLKRYMKIIC